MSYDNLINRIEAHTEPEVERPEVFLTKEQVREAVLYLVQGGVMPSVAKLRLKRPDSDPWILRVLNPVVRRYAAGIHADYDFLEFDGTAWRYADNPLLEAYEVSIPDFFVCTLGRTLRKARKNA